MGSKDKEPLVSDLREKFNLAATATAHSTLATTGHSSTSTAISMNTNTTNTERGGGTSCVYTALKAPALEEAELAQCFTTAVEGSSGNSRNGMYNNSSLQCAFAVEDLEAVRAGAVLLVRDVFRAGELVVH